MAHDNDSTVTLNIATLTALVASCDDVDALGELAHAARAVGARDLARRADERAEDVDASLYDDNPCDDPNDPAWLIDGVGFADPGGNSALRAATASNPRDRACPDCGTPNVLTRIDEARGYCCDACADRNEMGW